MNAITYIGIGSNLGDRRANCLRAVALLKERGIAVTKVSSLYETKPWGMAEQPDFINMAVEAETALGPEELLELLKDVERAMGREPSITWGPRLIDLDILLYDDIPIDKERLHIPHPLMQQRRFVLEPLAEIAPDRVHPVLKRTIRQLKEELDNAENA
ncbi:MAG: 2-amino-4-hydroxy-6-hydroxymethyldihydropteridine diphosphokinase [Nitrospirota bacterium]